MTTRDQTMQQLPCLFLFCLDLFSLLNSFPVSPPNNNITFYYDAFFGTDGICLTQETTCHSSSSPSHIGRALYVYPVRFLHDNASFTSVFSFSVIPNPICPFGDGVVFFLSSRHDSFSFFNGYMGLPQLDDDFNSQDSSFLSLPLSSTRVSTLHSVTSMAIMSIWLSYSSIKPASLLVSQIDLANQFKEYMHVGFWASNGLEDSSTINDTHKTSLKIGNMWILLGSLVASVVVIIAVPVICFVVMRKERKIKSVTLGFHRNRIVGEGASAVVYKGSVASGGAIAVKWFDQSNQKSFANNPFTTEFAALAGCLKHMNLVQLQGWCCEGNELVLVYEFLANGSLDRLLHRNPDSSTFLSWSLRLKRYETLHIILDDEFNAKLGDFGLAEVYEHNCGSREATIPAGTIGYLAPEYVYCGVPTVKTDVYSFGVVALEVATGKWPMDDNKMVLEYWVWDLWLQRKLLEAADWILSGRYNVSEMERVLVVGLCCVHPNHEKRPTVREAAIVLRGEAALPVLPDKTTVRFKSNLCRESEDILNFGVENSPISGDAGWLTPTSHFSKV
ncbi:putative Mitochondrial carrier protein [Hibiscus syriacus]|uniref:Mitochondrial carrier protein n=1 Tax=Hibiscus syriacus TaxID=106335 RepID=A0A6A2WK23_HIBSY|nr:putative Mitochondrial carrier protein [Hibiscus syriacus]